MHDYLRGVEHRGRLGVIYSNKDYGCEWDYDWKNKRFQRDDNTKFAVNMVSYALTRLTAPLAIRQPVGWPDNAPSRSAWADSPTPASGRPRFR